MVLEHVEADEHLPLPTVREVLTFSELQTGAPEVVAASEHLDTPIRWAHVVAGERAAELLDGGELILTTGAGWPSARSELESLALTLIHAGVAAIVLELGTRFESPPEALIDSCAEHGVPLIVLHRVVRFVQVTQRVHRRILSMQSEALEARVTVHRMLTELGLNRSPVDYVIEQISATLEAPVVLENTAGEVVAWSAPGVVDSEHVLTHWQSAGPPGDDPSLVRVNVEARGTKWGVITALPGPAHPAGRRTVLELGAFALALGRLSDTQGDQWLRHTSKRLIDDLLSGKYRRDVDLVTQLTASGLPVDNRLLVSVSLSGVGDFGSHESLERAVLETALRRSVAPEGRAIIAADPGAEFGADPSAETAASEATQVLQTGNGDFTLLALISMPVNDPRFDPQADSGTEPPFAKRLSHELEMLVPTTTPEAWRAHLSLGVPGRGVPGLLASVERVRQTGRVSASAHVGRVTVQQAERQPLSYLLRNFATSPELQQFVHQELGPLIEHDSVQGAGHSGDLLDVLTAYLAHPTNRSLAAQQSRLSRSVFYQRLERIEQLLGVNLADGQTIATLAVALAAYRP